MMVIRSGPVLRRSRSCFRSAQSGSLSDAELLAGFLAGRGEASEAAFAALVERDGPMVLRQRLPDPVRRRPRGRGCLPGHVFGFGQEGRFAPKSRSARKLAIRRGPPHRVQVAVACWPARKLVHDSGDDQMSVLDVARRETAAGPGALPSRAGRDHPSGTGPTTRKARTVIVLCCLEELTIEEAARRLRCTAAGRCGDGCHKGGRGWARLSRRGVAVPAGVMAAALSTRPSSAAVTPAIRDATANAAMAYSAGIIPAG